MVCLVCNTPPKTLSRYQLLLIILIILTHLILQLYIGASPYLSLYNVIRNIFTDSENHCSAPAKQNNYSHESCPEQPTSTKYFIHRGNTFNDWNETTDIPPCTNELFRDYYRNFHKFPEQGTWTIFNSLKEVYKLDFCEFKDFDMQQCVTKQQIKSLLILGDSQGRHYFDAMRKIVEADGAMCEQVRGESNWNVQISQPKPHISQGITGNWRKQYTLN